MTLFGNRLEFQEPIRYFKSKNTNEEVRYMCKKIRSVVKKMKGKNWTMLALNALAMAAVIQNMNAGCIWLDHQPEVPEEARRFRKF